jgi:hypothetical protein
MAAKSIEVPITNYEPLFDPESPSSGLATSDKEGPTSVGMDFDPMLMFCRSIDHARRPMISSAFRCPICISTPEEERKKPPRMVMVRPSIVRMQPMMEAKTA